MYLSPLFIALFSFSLFFLAWVSSFSCSVICCQICNVCSIVSVSSSLNSIQVDLNCGEVWNLYEGVQLSLMPKSGLAAEGDSDIQQFSITKKHLSCVPILQGTLTAIRDWFRDYKIPDGKPANKFGLGDKAADKVPNELLCFDEVVFCLS